MVGKSKMDGVYIDSSKGPTHHLRVASVTRNQLSTVIFFKVSDSV